MQSGQPLGSLRLHSLQVLTVTTQGVARNVVFADPRQFRAFGLSNQVG